MNNVNSEPIESVESAADEASLDVVIDARDGVPLVSYPKSEQRRPRTSIHDRHRHFRNMNVHFEYPEGEPNPVYFIDANYVVGQYTAEAHVEIYLGHFVDKASEFHLHNPGDPSSRAGAWLSSGLSESWGVKYDTVVTHTIPRNKMNPDRSVGELLGHRVKTWYIKWSYVWERSPLDAISGVMRQDPQRWLETPHDDLGQSHTHTYEPPDKDVFISVDGVETPYSEVALADSVQECLGDNSITELVGEGTEPLENIEPMGE